MRLLTRCSLIILLMKSVPALAASSGGWDCPLPFDGNIAGYSQCMQDAAQAAVDDAVEALQDSPFMANLPAEQAMLAMAKNRGLNDVAECLNEAGIQIGTVVSNAASDPWNLVQHRLNALMADAMQNSQQRVGGMLSRIAAGNTPSLQPANITAMVNEAYDLMIEVAAADPVASCALPVLQNQSALTRQTAQQAFAQIHQQSQSLMTTVIQPAIDSGAAVILRSMLEEMQQNSGPIASKRRVPKRQRKPSDLSTSRNKEAMEQDSKAETSASSERIPAQETKRDTTTPGTGSGLSASRKSNMSVQTGSRTQTRIPAKTRSGATLFSELPAMAIGGLQTVIGAAVPDDVERIALAEFTARTMTPDAIASVTWQLQALTGRLNGTGNDNFDPARIQALIDSLSPSNEALYSEIALATIKFYGHEVIDLAGEALVDFAVGTLGGVEAALDNAVGAVCSIASLPSGVPCNIVKGIVSFLYQQALVPTLNIAATAAVHAGWEMTADCGADAVRGGLNPAAAQGCGTTIASTLQWFPRTAAHAAAFVMPYLDETQTAMRDYHSAVLAMAIAAQNANN